MEPGNGKSMKHELWKDSDGETFCLAGPRGDAARKLLSPQAKLIWTIDALSHFDAMTAYYKFRDWGEYMTDQDWDREPYPKEWAEE
jgi:hypothetical protein